MLLDGVAQKVIQEWMDENHPLIVAETCLNSKQRKFVCTKCRDICPQGVYEADNPSWDLCKNCNLCVTACPPQAICPSSSVLRKLLGSLSCDGDTVAAGCGRSHANLDLQLDCLADLPWEMVARIALDKTLVLDTAQCPSCARAEEKAQLLAILTQVQAFLGAESFRRHVLLGGADRIERNGVSRRQAFSDLLKMLRTTVSTLLPDDDVERPAYSAVYRKVLVNHLLKRQDAGEVTKVTWETPVFSDACNGCSVCAKVCIHGAIELVSDAEGVRHMRHHGGKCTRCGLCETLCPEHAITGWAQMRTTDPLGAVDTAITAEEPRPSEPPPLTSLLKRDWLRHRNQEA